MVTTSRPKSDMAQPGPTPNRRALADLQYNNILALDQATSSEDEHAPATPDEDDVRKTVGVSIGKEQTRLLSPTTPAIEKAAAIDQAGSYFANSFAGATPGNQEVQEEPDEDGDLHGTDHNPPAEDVSPRRPRTAQRLPSPWRAGPTQSQRTSQTRSFLRDGLSFGRRRASSGPDPKAENRAKSIFPSFPSMPKNFSLTSPFFSRHDSEDHGPQKRESPSTASHSDGIYEGRPRTQSGTARPRASSSSLLNRTENPREAEESEAVGELPRLQPTRTARNKPPYLRRSTSDSSLVTQRTLSRVSSLGDDSRFENVSEQVNSRLKAIKDSLQDSSIRLPSMPSISNFSVSSFTPDFLNRERSWSTSSKAPGQASQPVSSHAGKYPYKPVDPITRQPYQSAKAALSDAHADRAMADHPNLTEAVEEFEGDLVVLGGYRGSVLRSADPPHRQLWVPVKVGLNLRKVDLEVPISEDGNERAKDTVIPSGMLTHIGPVDISKRLFRRLRSSENGRSGRLRLHDYGYDWRLDPIYLSKQLIAYLETLPDNRPEPGKPRKGVTVIAHSLGGLITRHAVNQRPDLFSGVIYAGVPKTCVNILGPLRNGDEVLLSSRVLTAQVNFTIRTSFALLPLNGRCFFDKNTREEYPMDFFDPQTWIDYRLSPCVARPLPPLAPAPKPTGLSGYVSSLSNALPSLPRVGRKGSLLRSKPPDDPIDTATASGITEPDMAKSSTNSKQDAVVNGNFEKSGSNGGDTNADTASPRTAVTIPRDEAIAYLARTLASVKKFKQELAFIPEHHVSNAYPPIAVIYGKSTPTVFGAKVDGREGIKHADAYDELAFASGDGVVLAKAAMVPEGYRTAKGGIVSSERGHVTLLGDLEAVGKCLNAVRKARKRGIGLGVRE
ncbi:hypothetical protein DOTSEDRAFT_69429 [Dothistroma septosporum NZE10]|uniref:Uncharacterized protein n=1 Tax=Dothistroma septosporum (strain NZE10 / CBS 128990) TaxID=675120 RepID=N1PYK4_DOTSN|nr:hypothetical protein DOTSEDRAFT_69429 [Dothistroma septosporum NZE10]